MRTWWRRLQYLRRRQEFEADLAEELAFHQQLKRQELIDAGLDSHQASVASRRALGSVALAVDRSRDVWLAPWLQDLVEDVRFGVRLLLKERQFALAAIAALALGLCAVTTAFTFVDGAMFRDLPFNDPDRLVSIRTVEARGRPLGVSYADARDWRQATQTLSHVVVSFEGPINISEEGLAPQRYNGSFLSFDAFAMVGRAPLLGRAFGVDDDRDAAARVAIIAHSVWRGRYASDPAIIGRSLRVNDVPATIVGVMPEGFHFPWATEVWVPVAQTSGSPSRVAGTRGNRNVLVMGFGRLANGTTIAQAQAEFDAITGQLTRDYPATNAGISVVVEPLENAYWGGVFGLRWTLLVVMATVSFVLLIACVNVATLLLARAVQRSREMAIRTALGATRGRLVRQLMAESVLLAAIAGVIGLWLSWHAVQVFSHALAQGQTIDGPPPFWLRFAIDGRVYVFLAIACLGTSLLFGLAPAMHLSLTSQLMMKDGGRGIAGGLRARRWTSALTISQLALTVVLLAAAGLMMRSYMAMYEAGRVLDTSNLITMQVALGADRYGQPWQRKQFFHQLDERLTADPAFSAVTVASDVPMMTRINGRRQLTIDGRVAPPEENPITVGYLYVGPRYWETLRLRLLRGRPFSDDDGAPGREAAIVNERFASLFFPNIDPIGQRIRLANAAAPNAPQPWFMIVGVAPTIPQIVFRDPPDPVVYVSLRGEPAPHRFTSIMVRAAGNRAAVVDRLRQAIRAVDPDLPGYDVQSMDEILAMSRFVQRVFGLLLGLLAGVGLGLASVGLYAVTAHAVTQRTQEIGIRVALGAASRQVVWLFVRRTCWQLLIGLVVGLAGAVILGRALQGALVRTASADPLALSLVSLLLIVVAMAASAWPARRAARVDPVKALRHE